MPRPDCNSQCAQRSTGTYCARLIWLHAELVELSSDLWLYVEKRIGIVPELYQAQSLKVGSTGSRIEGEDIIGVGESRFAKPQRQSAHLGSHSTGSPAQQRSVEYPQLQPACANLPLSM